MMTRDGSPATVRLKVRRRWTAAAHVGCGRPALSPAKPGFARWSHPREARVMSKEGAHGGTMGSPVIKERGLAEEPPVPPRLRLNRPRGRRSAGPERGFRAA